MAAMFGMGLCGTMKKAWEMVVLDLSTGDHEGYRLACIPVININVNWDDFNVCFSP